MGFTVEQQAAISTHGTDLLVSAAAGSGKTAVLVERIIQMITNIERPVSIDRLLVVTFTEAAASEMRRRISQALKDKLREDIGNEWLARQSVLLNQASITTIHSFCMKIARRNFHRLGIDANFRVADVTEIALMKQEIIQELFENLYDEHYSDGAHQGFINLVEAYCGRVNDVPLMELCLSLYEFVQSKPWQNLWLDEQCEKYGMATLEELSQSDWYKYFVEDTELILSGAADSIQQAIELANSPLIHPEYLATLYQDADDIARLKAALQQGIEKFHHALDYTYPRLSGKSVKDAPKEEVKELKERIKPLRDDGYKARLDKLRKEAFTKPPQQTLEDIQALQPYMVSLCELVKLFTERFAAAKREKNLADFNDLEHFALQALLEEGSTPEDFRPTEAAMETQQLYDEILIDEYQDSNLVQEMILLAVSSGQNRFMVGDIKQSIYRFRMANPDLFREKYKAFSGEKGGGVLISLAKNFRSRANVLKSINYIFRQIMSDTLGEVEYSPEVALIPGAEYPKLEQDFSTELILIDESGDDSLSEEGEDGEGDGAETPEQELNRVELEARITVMQIQRLLDSKDPFMVYDKKLDAVRPAQYSDIVILLRKTAGFEAYAKALKQAGIPSFAGSSKGYFGSSEVMTVLALLNTIDNPRQDVHLLSVLYSPIFEFSADELVMIRQTAPKGVFLDAMRELTALLPDSPITEKINRFFETLEQWRERAVYAPISKLLWEIYDETGYYDYAGAMSGGNLRQANLNSLFERAVQYEKTSLKGLFHFVKYIEKLLKNDTDFGAASVMGENENLVRIMTIHRSKGLEFPIVFVGGLGQGFNMSDANASFVMHQNLGLGSRYTDLKNRVKTSTLPRYVIARKLQMEGLSEEMRVLYVALTRAKEKLFLVGGMRNLEKYLESQRRLRDDTEFLPPYSLMGARKYLQWIIPALSRHTDLDEILPFYTDERPQRSSSRFNAIVLGKGNVVAAQQEELRRDAGIWRKLAVIDPTLDHSGQRGEIRRRLAYEYELEQSNIPAKLSVSEIKRLYYREFLHDSEELAPELLQGNFPKPEFMQNADGRMTAAQRGTLNHSILEHINLDRHRDGAALEALLDELIGRNVINTEERQYVNKNMLLNFVNSPLAERMRRAKWIKRELSFTTELAAELINSAWQSGEPMMIHGIIDCVFDEGGETVLVDYKTDYVPAGEERAAADKYIIQLALYKMAVEQYLREPVNKTIIYFLSNGVEVEIK